VNRLLVFRRGTLAAMTIAALALGLGCVERTRIDAEGTSEGPETPLWERYENDALNLEKTNFVLRYVEIGGRIECSGDRFFEQTTEVFARARFKNTGYPARVRQIYVDFKYMDGLLKGALTSQRNYDTDQAVVAETLRVDLNPGAKCSCVMVKGIMWIGRHNPVAGGVICPEEP